MSFYLQNTKQAYCANMLQAAAYAEAEILYW